MRISGEKKKGAPGEGNDVKRIDGFATSENILRW
jgi:hypothetical protein